MIARTVTLPMAEVLAQAPELSPWTDMELEPGFDLPTAQAIDQLSDIERVDAAMCIPGITWAQKALLSYMVRFGYACPVSYEGIRARRNMSERTIRNAVEQLEDKNIIKVIVTRLPNGQRHRFFVVRGGPLLAAYRLMVSGGAAGPSPANLAATPSPTEAAPANLAATPSPTEAAPANLAATPSPTEAAPANLAATPSPTEAAPANLAGKAANLAGKAANLAGKAANLAGDGDVSLFVSSNLNISSDFEFEKELTNKQPGDQAAKFAVRQDLPERAANSAAAGKEAPPAAYWWPNFLLHLEDVPGPHPLEWGEVSRLQHAADHDMNLLGEACARLLSTYPANPGRGERRIRNSFTAVIRAIYSKVIEETHWGAFPDDLPIVSLTRTSWFGSPPPGPDEDLGF